ncbi:Branched-chain-amino-acid aminotransferase 5, chloroplastic [Apostasia shenzhenica]|uniref:Branched-chain-amino-acid aminotransferase n=1 Tax=Apostasia shenzhenica TaxID=1088818 RepID=A0A2I0ARF6_9ASPA|nr:Branched-chain-amino-acid aminotransferase 5, chloroplastic [Apostasia shenzhenica]
MKFVHSHLSGDLIPLVHSPLSSSFLLGRSSQSFQSATSIKIQNHLPSMSSVFLLSSNARCEVRASTFQGISDLADINWDNIGFGLVPTDYMYIAKCAKGGTFIEGELKPFGPIQLSPSAGILNYGQVFGTQHILFLHQLDVNSLFQGIFEGLKAYRKEDGSILLFRPEQNALRMSIGAERMCMPSPSVKQFLEAVKQTVLANKRWVPPPGKGSLYIRPLLMGSGSVLGVAPAPEYTFLIFVSPVGNYFKEGLAPINLFVETEFHRATPGGIGGVKSIGNYSAVLKAQSMAKANGYSDVLYLDSIYKKYLEEASSCNVFIAKDKKVTTPAIKGTILPGITRKSIIEVAGTQGFEVEERLIPIEELLNADEVFCTGTAVVVSPVQSVTYHGKRVEYGNKGVGIISQLLYSELTRLQMGLTEDKLGWTVAIGP